MERAFVILLTGWALLAPAHTQALPREQWKTCGDGLQFCLQFCTDRRLGAPSCQADCKFRLDDEKAGCMTTGKYRWPGNRPPAALLEKSQLASPM